MPEHVALNLQSRLVLVVEREGHLTVYRVTGISGDRQLVRRLGIVRLVEFLTRQEWEEWGSGSE